MYTNIEKADAERVEGAVKYIRNRNISDATAILLDVCSRCPEEYQYEYTSGGTRYIKFWDMAEFIASVPAHGQEKKENIVWLLSAYPRACYHLAFVLVEKGDFPGAISWLTKGWAMEPRNPKFLLELGFVYGQMKEHQKSYHCYQQAHDLASESRNQRAVALRGMGVQLIDLQCLDEAEARLKESLELDPDNSKAKFELVYIAKLRSGWRVRRQKSWWQFWK